MSGLSIFWKLHQRWAFPPPRSKHCASGADLTAVCSYVGIWGMCDLTTLVLCSSLVCLDYTSPVHIVCLDCTSLDNTCPVHMVSPSLLHLDHTSPVPISLEPISRVHVGNKLCTKCTLCTKCALSTKFRLCPPFPSPSDPLYNYILPPFCSSRRPNVLLFTWSLSHLPRCPRSIALICSFTRLSYVRCKFSLHRKWTKFGQGTKPSKCLTCLRICGCWTNK